jgi:hypothetical protein
MLHVPLWMYTLHPFVLGVLMQFVIVGLSMLGLVLVRRYVLPRLHLHEGVNEAISGTVQAIGVFYGVTVGLIAVGVWTTSSNSTDLVSQEASSIGALYRDVQNLPPAQSGPMRAELKAYTEEVVRSDWPTQRLQGKVREVNSAPLKRFQRLLAAFEPQTPGEEARYAAALDSYNQMSKDRRLRLDAVEAGLSDIMWAVIWAGAAISIAVFYLFNIKDFRVHALLVGFVSVYLALVLFMIAINDKPFYGTISISPRSYELLLDTLMREP